MFVALLALGAVTQHGPVEIELVAFVAFVALLGTGVTLAIRAALRSWHGGVGVYPIHLFGSDPPPRDVT